MSDRIDEELWAKVEEKVSPIFEEILDKWEITLKDNGATDDEIAEGLALQKKWLNEGLVRRKSDILRFISDPLAASPELQ
jgi:hypothetical protein